MSKQEIPDETFPDTPDYHIRVKHHRAYRFVYFTLWIVEVLLAFRFFLKLLGANPDSVFAAIIYFLTAIFVFPFRGLFPLAVTDQEGALLATPSIFEPGILVAMIAYVFIAWGIAKWILIVHSKPSAKDQPLDLR